MFISPLCTKCLDSKIEAHDLGGTNERMYFSYRRVVTALQDGTELLCDGPLSFRGILDKPRLISDSWWPVDCKHLYRGHAASPKHGKKNDPTVKPDKQTFGSSLFGWHLNSSSFQNGGEKKKCVRIGLFLNDSWKEEKVHITPRMYIYMKPQRHTRHHLRGSPGSGWNLTHRGAEGGRRGAKLKICFHRCLITASLGSAPH